jgi:hypothetical protein
LPHNVFDQYAPTPLGNDVFAQLGDHFSLPLFGNFDPPVSSSGGSQTGNPHVWHNLALPNDVNNDGMVVAGDALLIINHINAFGASGVPAIAQAGTPAFYDTNDDGSVAANDVLQVINFINASGSGLPGPEGACWRGWWRRRSVRFRQLFR